MNRNGPAPVWRSTRVLLTGYAAAVALATLYPFRFEVPRYFRQDRMPPPVWDEVEGMVFDGIGMFWTGGPREDIATAVGDAGAFYLYVEAMPTQAKQYGPSRIVAYSVSQYYQAVMLGQWGTDLALRIRQDPGPGDRAALEWRLSNALAVDTWNAILVVANRTATRLFRNGTAIAELPGTRLTPDAWRSDCYLLAGNEATGNRGWYGRVRRLELGAGSPPVRVWAEAGIPVEHGETGDADAPPLLDVSAADGRRPTDWTSQKANVAGLGLERPWRLVPFQYVVRRDLILNVVLFVPIGWLLRAGGTRLPLAVIIACIASAAIESSQVFLPSRMCDTTDVLVNTAGALLGWILAAGWGARRGRVEAS